MKRVAAVLVLSLLVTSANCAGSYQQAAAQPGAYVYRGTIRSLTQEPPTITLLTGVGLAFRLIAMRVPPEARIERAGTAMAWGDLTPGQVVRADCRQVGDTLVAERVQVVEAGR